MGNMPSLWPTGGYRRPEFWLSAGWDAVERNGWRAPLYWTSEGADWRLFTLRGEQPMAELAVAPVSHVSYLKPTLTHAGRESGWRQSLSGRARQRICRSQGNLLDSGRLVPTPATVTTSEEGVTLRQMFGDCWEWTASAYLGYPGFRPLEGTLGEYNGKFMSGQMVLRGGSCVTPAAHIRASYRNFFAPETRWQFSGFGWRNDS